MKTMTDMKVETIDGLVKLGVLSEADAAKFLRREKSYIRIVPCIWRAWRQARALKAACRDRRVRNEEET